MTPEVYMAAAGILALPAGWLVNRQLEINRQVREHAGAIASIEENVQYTRSRVDDLCDYLIERGSQTRRRD